MFDLRTKLLDLDEDLERLTWGVQAARAVSAAISQDHAYGEGLYAVSDYLYEAQKKNARRPGPVPGAGKRGAVTAGGANPSPANFQKQLFILNKTPFSFGRENLFFSVEGTPLRVIQ